MFKKRSKVRTKQKVRRRTMDPGKRMLIRQLLIGLIVLVFVALAIVGLWYGTRLEQLTITTVNVSGGQTISHESVRKRAEAELEGTYIGLIPRRFTWWYPHEAILQAMKDVPRMKNLVVKRASLKEVSISFEEYSPYALWCNEQEKDKCLFIDNTGYAYSPAPNLIGGAMMRYRSLGSNPTVGSRLLDVNKLGNTTRFIDLIKTSSNFEVASVETDAVGDVFYILVGGGELKASLSVSAETVFENLQSILAAKEFSNLKPGSFQYIDLRFGNKVYVNDSPLPTSTSTATSSETAATQY